MKCPLLLFIQHSSDFNCLCIGVPMKILSYENFPSGKKIWEILNLGRLPPWLRPPKDTNLFSFRSRKQEGSSHKCREGVIRDPADKRDFSKCPYCSCFEPRLSNSMSFLWSEKLCSVEFWKINQLPLVNTCIPTLSFYGASHPDRGLWGLPHWDPCWEGPDSCHSHGYLQPQGSVWFCAILSTLFLPSDSNVSLPTHGCS